MNTHAVWDKALEGATPAEITRFAQLAPKTLANASTPDQEAQSRGKGLLLTKKQIIDLRKYEAAALALPFTLADVRDYLNFGDDAGGGAGLRAEDFLRTFSLTRSHAQRWSPLRESIMLTGSQLKQFAVSIRGYAKGMEEVYDDAKASGLLKKHNITTLAQLRKLQLEMGDRFPGIELDEDTVSDLGYYLNKIFEKVNANLKSVETIKARLDQFGYDLREHVLPSIKLRVSLIGGSSLPSEVEALKVQIDKRAVHINEKNEEYKKAVEQSVTVAAGMNLIGLAMAIYLGVEAESIRAARNQLYKEQEAAIETLRNKNQTLGSLSRVKHDLQGLELVAVDADIATQNLMHVWNVMHLYIKSSQDEIDEIDDALKLRLFMSAFQEVVSPWKYIETDADALIAVFKEADQEYERNYGIRLRSARMLMAAPVDYPSIDLKAMSQSGTLMRDGAVKSRALFIQWKYLPQLHDRFHDVVLNVSKSASALSETALRTKMALESQIDRLETLDNDWAKALAADDQEDIEDIEGERTKALKKNEALMKQPLRRMEEQLSAIDDIYDRRLSLGFIEDLEKDQRTIDVAVDQLKAARVERLGERKAISEAIALLEKSGVEKIGKDLVLTLEQVTQLGMAPPEMQLVMLAIEQLKKTLGQIGESIKFLDLVRERERLAGQIKSLDLELDMKNNELASLKGKVQFLQVIHSIDDQRQRYVGEYRGVVRAYQAIAAQIEAGKYAEPGERSRDFVQLARTFIEFLAPLSLPLRLS
ncbi:alpha-xenorhabdolysin family binary toxin subunit A [Pseudomonas sp. B21-056]|jgi:hypothetical protein|uniref:alpha-xenorhabdolysin family binary toxin subunit A n=1 Tax=Pseudomonas sp. B21-056 TaxID=2895495 RepID=UPI002230974B|nr:alpha-xenorhabdolysin family binary toxin subunit A [Pseudomonas sp. B21-056]UZE24573.1 alpha-xenorhabdolysin family binary toxin subunit A [Pseudomonas sp. B21-056]